MAERFERKFIGDEAGNVEQQELSAEESGRLNPKIKSKQKPKPERIFVGDEDGDLEIKKVVK